MPVHRFRTLDEARRALWRKPGDPELQRIIAWLWAFSAGIAGPSLQPRGVRKFRTIEETNADRKHWELERSRRLWNRHSPESAGPQT
jgi:hypothetical protein